jgi:hypothetical protein
MAVSKLLPSGGANDFNLNITGATTKANFDKAYSSGSYSIESSGNDTSLDFYAYGPSGNLVGYTSTKAFTASASFNKMVVVGGTVGDVLSFTFKKTFTTSTATAEVTAGPAIYSVSPSSATKVDDTVTITGANFASDVTVTFSSTTGVYTSTAAKSIVRSNSTSLIVTRPDNFPVANSPYTITVSNPGVSDPVGSSLNILANSVTAGSSPVWVTAAGNLPNYTKNVAYSTTLVATDADAGSAITYSIISGSLPAGLSFNGSTGVISGTPTGTLSSGSFTVRATDAGANFVERAFAVNNIGAAAPVWVTAAGALTAAPSGAAYSVTLVATDDSGTAPAYSIASGSLPGGLSLNGSTGVISGTISGGGVSSFTINATDANGTSTARAFTINVLTLTAFYFGNPNTGTSGWGYGNNEDCVTFTINATVLLHGCTGTNGSPNGNFRVYSGGSNASANIITNTSLVVSDPSYGGRKYYFNDPVQLTAGTYTFGYYQGSGSSGSAGKSGSAITQGGVTLTPSTASFAGLPSNGTDTTNGSFGHVVWLYI